MTERIHPTVAWRVLLGPERAERLAASEHLRPDGSDPEEDGVVMGTTVAVVLLAVVAVLLAVIGKGICIMWGAP